MSNFNPSDYEPDSFTVKIDGETFYSFDNPFSIDNGSILMIYDTGFINTDDGIKISRGGYTGYVLVLEINKKWALVMLDSTKLKEGPILGEYSSFEEMMSYLKSRIFTVVHTEKIEIKERE